MVAPRPHPPGSTTHADLAQLTVIAATYRELDTDAREGLAQALSGTDPLFDEQLTLHTCHRVEKIGLLANGRAPELPNGTHRFSGLAAVERVFLVAGGLDSAVIGEEQILGQVREAYREAEASGASGPVLSALLRRALRFGRRVRSEAQPGGDHSLADRAARWLLDERQPASTALVIGTGEMGRRLADLLAQAGVGVTVASRHLPRAQRLAASLPTAGGHTAVSLDELLTGSLDHHLVAVAVRDATATLGPDHLSRRVTRVVDLSTPRTVSAEAANLLGERLLDLDGLGATAMRRRLAPRAERRLRAEAAREAERFVEWLDLRASGSGVALLRSFADEVRRRHVARCVARAELTDAQAAAVDAMAAALVGELLHQPSVELSRDPEAGRRVRDLFGLG